MKKAVGVSLSLRAFSLRSCSFVRYNSRMLFNSKNNSLFLSWLRTLESLRTR